MGPNGLTRFFRRKALIRQNGRSLDMESLAEHNAARSA
jgi:hypothetical protein